MTKKILEGIGRPRTIWVSQDLSWFVQEVPGCLAGSGWVWEGLFKGFYTLINQNCPVVNDFKHVMKDIIVFANLYCHSC